MDGMGEDMPYSLPPTVTYAQPQSVREAAYRFRMHAIKATIRENLLALLRFEKGELPPGENGTSRLAKLAGKKGSWGQRLLDETDIGISVLADAAHMFGLQPWQLLVPGLDPGRKPALSGDASAWPFPMVSQADYWALPPEDRAWVQAKLDSAIRERMDVLSRRQPQTPPASLVDASKGNPGPSPAELEQRADGPAPTPSPPKDRGKQTASGRPKRP